MFKGYNRVQLRLKVVLSVCKLQNIMLDMRCDVSAISKQDPSVIVVEFLDALSSVGRVPVSPGWCVIR